MRRFTPVTSTILIILGSFALLVAQTSLWITTSLYNQAYFTNTLISVLKQESVRTAIAQEITSQALTNRPLLKRLAGTYLEPAMVGILGSSQFETMFRFTANKFHEYAITQEPQDITIDISTFKRVLILLTTLTETNLETTLNPNDLPDQITLVKANQIPRLNPVVTTAVWLGPLALLFALTLIALAIAFGQDPAAELARTGLIVAASALLYYLAIPYLNDITSVYLPSQTLRTIYTAFYTAFTTPLIQRLLNLVYVGLSLTVLVVLIKVISKNRFLSYSRRFSSQTTSSAPKRTTKAK